MRLGLQVSPLPAERLRMSCTAFPCPPQGDSCTWGKTGMTLMVMAWAWLQAGSLANDVFSRVSLCTGAPLMNWATLSGAQFILAPNHPNVLQRCGSQHVGGVLPQALLDFSEPYIAPHFSEKPCFHGHGVIWGSQLSTITTAVMVAGKMCHTWTPRFGGKKKFNFHYSLKILYYKTTRCLSIC